MKKSMYNVLRCIPLLMFILLLSSSMAFASELSDLKTEMETMQTNINVVWTCVAAFLVFFMQAGFAMVEAGFTCAKNAVNIIMKNLMDFSIGTLAFFFVGFGLMFGTSNGFFGTSHFMLDGVLGSAEHWNWTFLIFQTVFAGTAATIVSGAMAGRTKFTAYLVYSVFICAFIYPVFGSWAWGGLLDGGGWLENLKTPFCDFAGSTVVHSVGGWLALSGAIILGPRIGKYDSSSGKQPPFPAHNITLAALGVFILWFGWFGFNPGSTTVGNGEIGRVAVTTNLAAAAAAITAMLTAWIIYKKPDASMTLNGALAGLVSITAPCYTVTGMGALFIGAIGGIIVVLSTIFIDKVLRIDDPVGASSVHGVCGAWGTLACGLFNAEKIIGIGDANGGLFYGGGLSQLITQLIGVVTAFAWAFVGGLILFGAIKATIGIRVSKEVEEKGLDLSEHGMGAYGGLF